MVLKVRPTRPSSLQPSLTFMAKSSYVVLVFGRLQTVDETHEMRVAWVACKVHFSIDVRKK